MTNVEKWRLEIPFNGIEDVWYDLRTREEPEASNASIDWIAVGDDIKAGICTGWSNWILHWKLKYSTFFLTEVIENID